MTALAETFLDGKPKKLLIGGEWVDAASGATFPSVNPSTGAVIAELAEASAVDADRAVAAARKAFTRRGYGCTNRWSPGPDGRRAASALRAEQVDLSLVSQAGRHGA